MTYETMFKYIDCQAQIYFDDTTKECSIKICEHEQCQEKIYLAIPKVSKCIKNVHSIEEAVAITKKHIETLYDDLEDI